MKKFVLRIVPVLAFTVGMAGCSQLIWDNDLGSKESAPVNEKKTEVVPEGLNKTRTNPISPPDESRTSVSRAKIVSVQTIGENQRGERKYFEVVDKTIEQLARVTADPAGKPVRIVTYDNNAMQRDYPMDFGKAWGRTLEAMLDMPLDTIDKSSGVITTAWVYDRTKADSNMLIMGFGGGAAPIRYKYTVRLLSRGSVTQIKVVPHAEVRKTQQWDNARAKLLITKKLFDRIELELRTPLNSDRF